MVGPYKIISHQDFYEIVDKNGKSCLVADRHDNAYEFLTAALKALNDK